jgi:hypothetical protein
MKKASIFMLLPFLFLGCIMPEARVFQKKVPVEQISPEILEGQRQGAEYIEQKSASPGADPVKTIEEIHAVAAPLSASLGEPEKKVTPDNGEAVIAALKKALIAEQKKADDWKKFSQKYSGIQLEGTGIDLAAPGALLGVGTLIALFIFVPGTLSVALFVMRRLRLTLQQTVKSVEEFAAENPEAAASLKARQSSNLDRAEKAVVAQVKKYIKPKV